MTLANPTAEDLARLRGLVSLANTKVKFLAFYYPQPENPRLLHILAYTGNAKLTPNGWREYLHPRLEGIRHAENLRSQIISVSSSHGFEQFGSFRGHFKARPVIKKVEPQEIIKTKPEEQAPTGGIKTKPDEQAPKERIKTRFDNMSLDDYMKHLKEMRKKTEEAKMKKYEEEAKKIQPTPGSIIKKASSSDSNKKFVRKFQYTENPSKLQDRKLFTPLLE